MAALVVALLVVLVFVGLVLLFALLGGRCSDVKFNAKVAKIVDVGTHVRFDTESTRPLPKVEAGPPPGPEVGMVWWHAIAEPHRPHALADTFED